MSRHILTVPPTSLGMVVHLEVLDGVLRVHHTDVQHSNVQSVRVFPVAEALISPPTESSDNALPAPPMPPMNELFPLYRVPGWRPKYPADNVTVAQYLDEAGVTCDNDTRTRSVNSFKQLRLSVAQHAGHVAKKYNVSPNWSTGTPGSDRLYPRSVWHEAYRLSRRGRKI